MTAELREIVFNCEHPASLARFWASVLNGYAVRAYDDAEVARLAALGFTPETDPTVMVDGPGLSLCFQKLQSAAPMVQPALAEAHVLVEAHGHRLHLDVHTADVPAEVQRLCALGATLLRTEPSYCVLRDPERNRFCVVRSTANAAGSPSR